MLKKISLFFSKEAQDFIALERKSGVLSPGLVAILGFPSLFVGIQCGEKLTSAQKAAFTRYAQEHMLRVSDDTLRVIRDKVGRAHRIEFHVIGRVQSESPFSANFMRTQLMCYLRGKGRRICCIDLDTEIPTGVTDIVWLMTE